MIKKLAYLCLLVFIASACSDNTVYKSKKDINNEFWVYEDAISFDLEAPDTINWYELGLDVKHSKEFGYQNLYLYIDTRFPSDTLLTDLINLDLAKKNGQWNGDCNSKSCSNPFILKQKFKFEELGEYSFAFKQASRQDSLKGIQSLSLKLKKADQS